MYINTAIETLAGFAVERFTDIHDNFGWTGIRAKRLQHLDGQRGWIDEGDFECNNNFNEFVWQNIHKTTATNEITTEIKVTDDGRMSIDKSKKQFFLSDLCIPEILVESAARAFLDYDSKEVLIDVVMYDGRIIPAIMSKKITETTDVKGDPAQTTAYEIRLHFLYTTDAYEYLYFNSDKEIVKKVSKSNTILVIEKSSWPELLAKFSKWSQAFNDLFPGKNKLKI